MDFQGEYDISDNCLLEAVRRGDVKMFRSLLKLLLIFSSQSDDIKNTCLKCAVNRGNKAIVKLLLEDPDPDSPINRESAIFDSLRSNKPEIAKLLIDDRGSDACIGIRGYILDMLYVSIEYGWIEQTLMLADSPLVNYNARRYAVAYAIEEDNTEMAEILLRKPGYIIPSFIDAYKGELGYASTFILDFIKKEHPYLLAQYRLCEDGLYCEDVRKMIMLKYLELL
jgi:hypothetical protein